MVAGVREIEAARELMAAYAARTGIGAPGTAGIAGAALRRYLWTDAFAVCAFLALHRATGDAGALQSARQLVDLVHAVLGRHRGDDGRSGPLSGLPEADAQRHPTRGGLRIGKPRPERRAGEPFDERAEWDRDGQYLHYLTRWMHALARMAAVTGERRYADWGAELLLAAHAAFAHAGPDGRRRLWWKASIDLRRPLVASMGQHDPLDAMLAALELQSVLRTRGDPAAAGQLEPVVVDLRGMGAGIDLVTHDPLGIGGLLGGSAAVAQWLARGESADVDLLQRLLAAAARGLLAFEAGSPLQAPPEKRLAFRELGLAIGLSAVPRLVAIVSVVSACSGAAVASLVGAVARHAGLGARLRATWLDPHHRATAAWHAHQDIDEVMLAASLAPDVYLDA